MCSEHEKWNFEWLDDFIPIWISEVGLPWTDLRGVFFTDVACDSYCNIIACDMYNSKIHLLCPNGNFIMYLLTETEVKDPWSMSLYKSTLWVGDNHGLVKVFQYKASLKQHHCVSMPLNSGIIYESQCISLN